jgi:hypothetical protein
MSTPDRQEDPTDEELRAALEEQLRHISSSDVIAQTAISLINLAGRRLGLTEDTKDERDLLQVRDGVDAVRALLPILERSADAPSLAPLRDALATLQMEYAKLSEAGASAEPAAGSSAGPATPAPEDPSGQRGPAQQSGRLWVPGTAERPPRQ